MIDKASQALLLAMEELDKEAERLLAASQRLEFEAKKLMETVQRCYPKPPAEPEVKPTLVVPPHNEWLH
jgi:hypothetical protein